MSVIDTVWNITLHTERLELRPLQSDDYEMWYAGFTHRLPAQHAHDPGRLDLTGCHQEWFTALCQRHQRLALDDQVYIWGIFLRTTGMHLGAIDIATIRRAENQWANLGYGIHNQFWRQGFAREAAQAALTAGFRDLYYHRIEAAIHVENHPSIALARAVGMNYEGIRRGFFYENDTWADHVIYASIPGDVGLPENAPQT